MNVESDTEAVALIQSVCDSLQHNNPWSQLAKLLGHQKKHSSHWEEALRSGGPKDAILCDALFSSELSHSGLFDWDVLARALLISPSSHETPWKVVCLVLQRILLENNIGDRISVSHSSFLTFINTVQEFLQQVAVEWYDSERKRMLMGTTLHLNTNGSTTTPSYWLRRMASIILESGIEDTMCDSGLWNTALSVLASVVRISKGLHGSHEASFDIILLDGICTEQLLRQYTLSELLSLSWKLRDHFRSQDWNRIHQLAQEANYDPRDQSQLSATMLDLAIYFLKECTNSSYQHTSEQHQERFREWQQLFLERNQTEPFRKKLSSLSMPMLRTWIQCCDHQSPFMWLLCAQRASDLSARSNIASLLHRNTPEINSWQNETTLYCWEQLVSTQRHETSDAAEEDIAVLANNLCYYSGQGQFIVESQGQADRLTKAGTMVFKTLPASSHLFHDTASIWINLAVSVLNNDPPSALQFLALVSLIVVYVEVPSCRSLIERPVQTAFSIDMFRDQNPFESADLYCPVLSVLASTVQHNESLRLESFFSILKQPLPLVLFERVCDIFVSSPAGRVLLWDCSEQKLATFQRDTDEDGTKRSLYALITLTLCSDWSRTEENAWLMLSSIIVDCRSPLTFTERCWLFSTLRRRLEASTTSITQNLHLLRCCVTRLLAFVGINENESLIFRGDRLFRQPKSMCTRNSEDIVGLSGLLLDLLNIFVSDSESILGQEINEQSLAWCRYYERAMSGREASSSACHPELEDDSALACCACFYFLSILLECVKGESFSDSQLKGCSPGKIRSMLASQEVASLRVVHDKSRLPCWLSQPQQDPFWSQKGIVRSDTCDQDLLYLVFSDILVDFFASPRWPWSRTDTSARGGTLTQLVGDLLSAKQRRSVKENYHVPLVHRETMMKTYIGLLNVQAGFIEPIAETYEIQNRDLPRSLDVVGAICDIGKLCSDPFISLDILLGWGRSLKRIHKCVARELSIVKLIKVLEAACGFQGDEGGRSVHSGDLFPEIGSQDDLDDYLRAIRLSIICAIADATKAINKSLVDANFLDDSVQMLSSSELCEMVLSFCDDLSCGVDGKSGGLTADLFQGFLDCIENSTKLLHLMSTEMDEAEDFLKPFVLSTRSLENLLNFVSPSDASLFKGVVQVLSSTLPNLIRSFLAASANGAITKDFDFVVGPRSTSLRIFSRCASVLTAMAGSNPVLWWREKEIALLSDDEAENDDSHNGRSKVKGAEIEPSKTEKHETFHFCDERSWTRSFNAAASAFESDFSHATKRINSCVGVMNANANLTSQRSYVRSRSREFTAYVVVLSKALEKVPSQYMVTTTMEMDASLPSYLVCAMSLPVGTKTRFAAAVEGFFSVLNLSFSTFCEILTSSFTLEKSHQCPVFILEALSVALGWLRAKLGEDVTDICFAFRRWNYAEKKKFGESTLASSSFVSEDSSWKKFPRIERKLDECEANLKKLAALLRGQSVLRDNARLLALINALISSERKPRDFSKLILEKTESLEGSYEDLEKEIGCWQKNRAVAGKHKISKETTKHMKKARKQNTMRSRNDVIDSWMQLDEGIGGERGDNDAFADLEDFLVPG